MELTASSRFFSLRDANALVPTLQETFARARSLRDSLARVHSDLSGKGHAPAGPAIDVDAGAPAPVQALQRRGQALSTELFALLREISDLGIEVRAADGLVDFRSRLRGRTVFLCWRFGETGVVHWHEPGTGFSGRRPLPEDAEFVGDLLH
ncbi:MAG: DUF2203 domain-containing protein [Myxococcales bacterium]